MNRNRTTEPTVYELAGLLAAAALASTATALAVVYAVRRRRPASGHGGPTGSQIMQDTVPVQPAVNVAAPATLPHHFSEDVVIPGLTMTGAEIEHDDAENGRSPEGV